VEAHLDPSSGIDKSWKRNASLALVKLQFESATNSPRQGAEAESDSQIFPILQYLNEYGNASTAYNDIRQFAERLGPDERMKILERLDDAAVQVKFNKMAIEEEQNVSFLL
jgi:N-terminal acetyltransferase B complex non-catalytic subunit